MSRALKNYDLLLEVCGPVFVGSGNEISKKEYLFLGNNTVGILDINKLYMLLHSKGLSAEFETYMLDNRKEDLRQWLQRNRQPLADIKKCMKYTLESGNMEIQKGTRIQIMEHIKDAYGNPYIPGSSVKGMLRTILLGGKVMSCHNEYDREAELLFNELLSSEDSRQSQRLLRSRITQIESKAFHILEKSENKKDAVNDLLSALIIGDSEPLKTRDLVLCQKVEKNVNGREKTLNLFRECIRPGTIIKCSMTIDESTAKKYGIQLKSEKMKKAIADFAAQYYSNFANKFPGAAKPEKNTVYLGGGCGFVSKTIMYPMFPGREGVRAVKTVFDKTRVPRVHGHSQDLKSGVSPHILKCTRYQGRTLEMGRCRIKIIEKAPVSRDACR